MIDKKELFNGLYGKGYYVLVQGVHPDTFLVPHSFSTVGELMMSELIDYDFVEMAGDEFTLYKCAEAHNNDEAVWKSIEFDAPFYIYRGRKYHVNLAFEVLGK